MNNRTKITFDACLNYLSKGYSILPCGQDKKPLIKWKEFQERKATEDEILEWLKKFPNMNIGIVCGKISGITVLDFDVGHDKQTSIDLFPQTLTHSTPSGGKHLIYKYQQGITVSANAHEKYPYMDERGDTGFIVAPPSTTLKGEYKVLKDLPIADFPVDMFPKHKVKRSLTSTVGVKSGDRNSSIASIIGKLLLAEPNEEKWITDVLPAIQQINKTYTPILSDKEVLTVFNSIMKKEKKRKENLPIAIDGHQINMFKTRSGISFCNMANVVVVLDAHPIFKDKIRYNTFSQEIEIDGKPLEDEDIIKVQHILQTQFGLHSINKDAVYSALIHCAYQNRYDEAIDWLTSLKWDGEQRLFTWLTSATGVEDNAYNRGVSTHWFLQIANRIMNPGCLADYMLVLVGGQGIGKTSLFRIIGGKYYKAFTGSVENKDFYLTLRKALIIDLDEGATLYKAEAIKIKSIITETHDEFRAPYDRVPKKFPRRFVFSMSTNEIEPFRDATGNRRYWAVDLPQTMVNFKWLEDNREQLFAEALHWLKDKDNAEIVPQVPKEEAERIQEAHLPDDAWTDIICDEVRKSVDYCEGSINYSVTISEIFSKIFPDKSLINLDRRYEMRISNVFKNQLGLVKIRRMVEGEQKNRWYISSEKMKKLQAKNATQTKVELDEYVEEMQDSNKQIPF